MLVVESRLEILRWLKHKLLYVAWLHKLKFPNNAQRNHLSQTPQITRNPVPNAGPAMVIGSQGNWFPHGETPMGRQEYARRSDFIAGYHRSNLRGEGDRVIKDPAWFGVH